MHPILELLSTSPGLRAKEIAGRLGMERQIVNHLLHGELRASVVQDHTYCWRLVGQTAPHEVGRDVPPIPSSILGKLAKYFLECISFDQSLRVSAFAKSSFELEYTELPRLPFLEDNAQGTLEAPEAKRLLQKANNERSQLSAFVGYPIRLRHHRGTKGWQGYFVEPVLLFPFQSDPDNQGGRLTLSPDIPLFNEEVLRRYRAVDSGFALDEVIALSEELGLIEGDQDPPELDEVFLKLQEIRSGWDWLECIDPYNLSSGYPISELARQGIYNRAVLIVSERPKFTLGLETELARLLRCSDSDWSKTALGTWLGQAGPVQESTQQLPLLEVIPLNQEQREAISRSL